MQPGVGTNRFSYSFNDPVNKADPNGNSWKDLFNDFWAAFAGGASAQASKSEASETALSLGRYTVNSILTSPLRAGEAVVGAYDYVQQNTVSGNMVLPDRVAIMSGDPMAIAGMVPIARAGKLAEKVIEGAGDVANNGERIVIKTNSVGESVVNIQGKEMSFHGSKQVTKRGILNERIADAMEQNPFSHSQNGETLQGYYDASTDVFVCFGDRIVIVMEPRNPTNHISNLRGKR